MGKKLNKFPERLFYKLELGDMVINEKKELIQTLIMKPTILGKTIMFLFGRKNA